MEDACIHNLDLNDGNALFGVFDGHGGNPNPLDRFRGEQIREHYLREIAEELTSLQAERLQESTD